MRSSRLLAFGLAIGLLLLRSAEAQQLPVIEQTLVEWVAAQKHALPNSMQNFDQERNRNALFETMLSSIVSREWEKASQAAQKLNYQLAKINEANGPFVVAADHKGVDPIVVVNMSPSRDVIVQAPHVPFEKGTAEQAITLLKNLGARAAIISGAHRCASRSFTLCNGRTAVCSGSLESFRASDVGHNNGTLFHLAHTLFSDRWRNSIVMSLHRMEVDSDGVRTAVIISNGVMADDNNAATAATRLRFALSDLVKAPGRIVSCNVGSDSKYDYRPLCGFTNVQGRHVNGDKDACRFGVMQGTGRFIHLEQDRSVLDPYAENLSEIERHPFHRALIRSLSEILPAVPQR